MTSGLSHGMEWRSERTQAAGTSKQEDLAYDNSQMEEDPPLKMTRPGTLSSIASPILFELKNEHEPESKVG